MPGLHVESHSRPKQAGRHHQPRQCQAFTCSLGEEKENKPKNKQSFTRASALRCAHRPTKPGLLHINVSL